MPALRLVRLMTRGGGPSLSLDEALALRKASRSARFACPFLRRGSDRP